ncbi:MAG: DUF21 domain-containing protein [Kiritimatiellae bacterium]|nr:DUF21 domain-containing protein [Kiritimatiellia bacterium]
MIALLFILLIFSLLLAAFCAGSETGLLSLSRGRITHLAREGSKSAKILSHAIQNMPLTLTTLLIGNNLAAVTFSSVSAALCARLFSGTAAKGIWSFFAALSMLYLSEFLPKLFCSARPLRRMLSLARVWEVFSFAMKPLALVAHKIISKFSGKTSLKYKVTTSDLLRILQDRKDGVRLTDFESALISRILVLRKKGEPITVEKILSALDDAE